jgi:hypothetical protein
LTRIGYPDWCECCINRALDYDHCACNLPYYGPRNRTLASYWYNSSFSNTPQPQANPSLPPTPEENEKFELPPAPAAAGIGRLNR